MSVSQDSSTDALIVGSCRNGNESGGFWGRGRLLKKRKRKRKRGGGRGRGRGRGRDFRSPSPKRALTSQGVQVQEMLVIRGAKADSGTKLCISNLDYGVSDEDIEELFSMIGELQRYSIHCDRKGRSKGTGEVVFAHQSDALAAIDRYDNVRLDGKPMKVELVVERIDVYTKAKNY